MRDSNLRSVGELAKKRVRRTIRDQVLSKWNNTLRGRTTHEQPPKDHAHLAPAANAFVEGLCDKMPTKQTRAVHMHAKQSHVRYMQSGCMGACSTYACETDACEADVCEANAHEAGAYEADACEPDA